MIDPLPRPHIVVAYTYDGTGYKAGGYIHDGTHKYGYENGYGDSRQEAIDMVLSRMRETAHRLNSAFPHDEPIKHIGRVSTYNLAGRYY